MIVGTTVCEDIRLGNIGTTGRRELSLSLARIGRAPSESIDGNRDIAASPAMPEQDES